MEEIHVYDARIQLVTRFLVVFALALTAGCFLRKSAEVSAPVDVLAVLAVAPDPAAKDPLPEGAGRAIAAQIYGALADGSRFRVVPDLTSAQAMQAAPVRGAGDSATRAVALGKEVRADAVIFGTVSRFRERVGTQYGATVPAAVSFDLKLVVVATGKVVWEGRFDETQQPLTSNLLNWWMFWRGGPRWFTAAELGGLGVERLVEDMRRALERR